MHNLEVNIWIQTVNKVYCQMYIVLYVLHKCTSQLPLIPGTVVCEYVKYLHSHINMHTTLTK